MIWKILLSLQKVFNYSSKTFTGGINFLPISEQRSKTREWLFTFQPFPHCWIKESWCKLGCWTSDSAWLVQAEKQLCPRSFALEGRAGHSGDSRQLVLLSLGGWMWPQGCFYAVVWLYPPSPALGFGPLWVPCGPGWVCITLSPSKCLNFSRSTQAHGSMTNMCCGSVWNFYFIDKDNTRNDNSVLRAFVMVNRNFVEHRNMNSDSHGDSEEKISLKFRDNLNSGIFKLLSVWFCGLDADF